MTARSASETLRAGRLLQAPRLPEAPVFLLHGTDDYLREQVLDRLRKELLDPGFAEFNHVKIHCTQGTKIGLLSNALVDLPMMADLRLVEIHEAQVLPAEVARSLASALADAARAGGTVVALAWRPGGRGSSRSPLLEAAAAVGLTVECSLAEADRPSWLREALKARGVEAEPAAMQEILARTGSDLRHLASQVEKLALYVGSTGRVRVEDVRQVVMRSAEVKTWTLTAAIGKKNLREAMGILNLLLEEGEAPGGLLSYLNSYLRGLAQVLALSRSLGPSASAIAAEIKGRKEFQVRKSLEELRTWSEAERRLALDMLCRADLRLKTGSDPRLVLELLVFQLCARRGERGRR